MIHFIIVNINGLKYTRPLIKDLEKQSSSFLATIYDQGSSQPGTDEFLLSLEHPFSYIKNPKHIHLNKLWNTHFYNSDAPYLCFLNNDIRAPNNFVADTVRIFELEPEVGCVIHTTNHPNFSKVGPLDYVILSNKVVQGWDFTLRREAYTPIPSDLETYGGDDFLFTKLYDNNWKVAVALSSPIKHYYARSRKYYIGDRQSEAETYAKYGFKRLYMCQYSQRFPSW